MPTLIFDGERLSVREKVEEEKLRARYYGEEKDGNLFLEPEEALYLMDILGWRCFYKGEEISFTELASFFIQKNPRLFARYNTLRDWRERGLVIKKFKGESYGEVEGVKYPSKKIEFFSINAEAHFFPTDMISIIPDGRKFSDIFTTFWFGQLGTYKKMERGRSLKLDVFETLFLQKHCNLKVKNVETNEYLNFNQIIKLTKSTNLFKALYEVYEDWRLRGFIVKTGYKFGSHFRIYFPGASPIRKDKWVHSKHVLHIFPKYERMLISEWARAIRVAHSVRKTFILGIPGMKEEDYVDITPDFIAYHREGGRTIFPTTGKPSFLILSLSEDEFIGGAELASVLRNAKKHGLKLLLAVTGRESDVTYYLTKRIDLPGSKYEYYEIEWFQP